MKEEDNGVFFEITVIGNSVKVTAIDGKTGIEASIVAPRTMSPFTLKENAKRKLRYVIEKKGS